MRTFCSVSFKLSTVKYVNEHGNRAVQHFCPSPTRALIRMQKARQRVTRVIEE
jgi:hypothetical protein